MSQGSTFSVTPVFGVLANDSDPEGKPLTALVATPPVVSQGTLTLQSNGSFTFASQPSFTGAASFTYRASDGVNLSTPATVTLTVNADTDQDGLDDTWETANFGSLAATPTADSDGDGLSNAEELIMGTNPMSPSSVMRAAVRFDTGSSLICSFPTVDGRLYSVETSPELGAGASWQPLPSQPLITGNGTVFELPVTMSSNRIYFRVVVSR